MPELDGRYCSPQDLEFYKATQTFAWNDQALWDTTRITGTAVSAADLRLYAVILGQQGDGFTASGGKTYAETNHTESGKMSSDRAYRISSMGFDITSPVGSIGNVEFYVHDLQELARNLVVAFNSGDTTRWYGRISDFPVGGGFAGFAAIGNDESSPPTLREVGYMSNGLPSFGSMVRFCEDIKLAPAQSFSWIIKIARPLTLLNGSSVPYDIRQRNWGMMGVRVVG